MKSSDRIFYLHDFSLDTKKQVQQRVRYSLWQALGDVGGFHDGLSLLVGILMSPLATLLFKRDFVA